MARKSGAGGGQGGGGVESICPPVGPVTAFLGLGLFVGGLWLAIRHPKSALKCVFGGAVITVLLMASGGADGNPIAHPFVGLLAIAIGFMCAPDKSADKKHTNKKEL